MEQSKIIGDIRFSPKHNEEYTQDPKRAETFMFELSELMRLYKVVKIDVCLDYFDNEQPTD